MACYLVGADGALQRLCVTTADTTYVADDDDGNDDDDDDDSEQMAALVTALHAVRSPPTACFVASCDVRAIPGHTWGRNGGT